jgi:hypothetical protein
VRRTSSVFSFSHFSLILLLHHPFTTHITPSPFFPAYPFIVISTPSLFSVVQISLSSNTKDTSLSFCAHEARAIRNDVATDKEKGVRKIYNERGGRDDKSTRKTMRGQNENEGMLIRCGVHGRRVVREWIVGGSSKQIKRKRRKTDSVSAAQHSSLAAHPSSLPSTTLSSPLLSLCPPPPPPPCPFRFSNHCK